MKKALSIFTLLLLMAATMQAQEKQPDWKRWHYLSEAEMHDKTRGVSFTETDPPTGEPRFVAEFEPMQGVMIRYPLGIPTSLVAQMSNNCMVYCIVATQQQNQAQSSFQNAGVNMSNVTFVNAASNSYWVRDYAPWYIFEDRHPAIVDNIYNRPRPDDDNMSGVFANFWDIPMYGMRVEHTGGNMMQDGRGHGVSDDLVFNENLQHLNINEATVRQRMRDYLGIDPYHVTIDPQGDYIAHVDCWGKYLAPDKILIARLPQNNPRYPYYEQVAEYFENTNCCWGYPYKVYRVDEPGGYTVAPYTNSLILNKTVYVPLGSNSNYNNQALAVYQEAMPGYEIVGVTNNTNTPWENTDALHCRTRGVMDFDMLYIDHRNVLFGEQEWQDSIPVVSKFIAYSGANLKQDSLLVYYSIDGGAYQTAHMIATDAPDVYIGYIKGYHGGSEIDYYVFGADESGHRYTQPVFADLDPHHFTMEGHEPTPQGELVIAPDTLWFEQIGDTRQFVINNEAADPVTIHDVTGTLSLYIEELDLPCTLQTGQMLTVTVRLQTPPPGKDDYNEYDIQVMTTMGVHHVTAMVKKTTLDFGLTIIGSPHQYVETVHGTEGVLQNRYFGSLIPVDIYSITEDGTNYLNIEPQYPLPYTLEPAEYFTIMFYANSQAKGSVETSVIVESSDGQRKFVLTIDDELLNVNEISSETKLYPNPTTGQFNVEGANVAKVEVYNLVGQKVHEAEGKTISIDAAEWHKGIYLVNIIDQNGSVVTKKLVVK